MDILYDFLDETPAGVIAVIVILLNIVIGSTLAYVSLALMHWAWQDASFLEPSIRRALALGCSIALLRTAYVKVRA